MTYRHSLQRYRNWYARLLRLYPKLYRERFAEPMEQTFSDLLRERAQEGNSLFRSAAWMFIETFTGIIKENVNFILMKKNIIRLALVTASILMIPLVAMQFSSEVNWTLFDFVFAGGLIFGTGLAYQLITRKKAAIQYRWV